jgi:hypothetical protein
VDLFETNEFEFWFAWELNTSMEITIEIYFVWLSSLVARNSTFYDG